MHVKTLIIGNGFAGRTVARSLAGECLIVERGEKFNIFERRQRFLEMEKSNRHDALIRRSYESKHAFNVPDKLGVDCASEYILVDGGCSNHWGGLSFRLSEHVFSQSESDFPWPFTLSEMQPYYRTAEQLLRISADVKDPDDRNPVSEIKGASKWHDALGKYFPDAYIGAQAHNLSMNGTNDQGHCMGAGDCELCPMDAKTRSLHVHCGAEVLNDVMVDRLRFESGRAVEAICTTEDGPLSITFDQVVVAAHGVESFKLLCKSDLPSEVPRDLLGHHYQDHAVAELACIIPGAKVPFFEVNTAAQLVIPELSGAHAGIEYTTLALMTPPSESAVAAALDLAKINQWKLQEAIAEMGSVISLYVLLEIPPEWDVSMSYADGKLNVDMSGYHQNKVRYNQIIADINAKLKSLGAIPLPGAEQKHYLNAAGTHHLVGMLGMGSGPRAVVSPDFKLKGTDNVFVAGSALFPRCGSRNPTVTVVALSLMLGEQLKSNVNATIARG
ncbi:GMC oxidoreductase [Pseudomonas aeruginosa]|uniref:GMC oxidoreductase n=1 Tax=Pseudomonas aeruginosa TaxID=287 RepID=UPI002B276250|nr:GMC oxidoreductase [Pseudomonas aeruginosa]MEA8593011.1 GMC oxidoreductase [Pseudomonas aeruginosa]